MVTQYNISESNQLVSGLQANLDNSKNVYTNLKQAMRNLSNALANNQLQGMTYYSANRYFMQVLNPLVTKGSKIVSDGESDLKVFTREAKKINDYGDLDKTKLEADKQVKEETKRSAETHLSELNSLKALKTIEPYLYDQLVKTAEATQTQMTKDIKKIDEKLRALETFETNTNELFIDSFTALEAFQRAVAELKNVKISSSGFVTIPDNIFKLIEEMDSVKLAAGDKDSEKARKEADKLTEKQLEAFLKDGGQLMVYKDRAKAKLASQNEFASDVSFEDADVVIWYIVKDGVVINLAEHPEFKDLYKYLQKKGDKLKKDQYKTVSYNQAEKMTVDSMNGVEGRIARFEYYFRPAESAIAGVVAGVTTAKAIV